MINFKQTFALATLAASIVMIAPAYAAVIPASGVPSSALQKKVSAIGSVKGYEATTTNNMYAWYLEKNGKTLVIYNTPDEASFIKGTIYDMASKKVISDKYAVKSLEFASPEFREKILSTYGLTPRSAATAGTAAPVALSASEQAAYDKGYMNIKWQKDGIPEALQMIDGLSGAKEGNAAPQDTVYIFYDPRCPWCHKTFDATRSYVKKGYSIKWIPTVALGRSDAAYALAAAPIQLAAMLEPSFQKKDSAKATAATKSDIKAIDTNLQFLSAYFKKVMPDDQISVPIALFLDKTSGKVTHLQGLSDKPALELLFGELK